MAFLVLKTRDPVWVPTPKRQVEEGLTICLREGKVWSTTGLPAAMTVQVQPADVAYVR
jgi:hypothetical protein